jgi:hypothetical protein
MGAPLFGSVLEASDSYGAVWATFAALSLVVAAAMALLGGAIHRECVRARDQAWAGFVGAWSSEIPLWTAQNGRAVFTQ